MEFLRRSESCDSEYPAMLWLPNQYSPPEGLSSMPTMLRKVDFPQPDGPITATNSPPATSRLMSRSAVVSTSVVRYTLLRFFNLIMGCPGSHQLPPLSALSNSTRSIFEKAS